MNPKLRSIPIPDYEEVYEITDPSTGLLGVIALHSTQKGPALGGARICAYPDFDAALEDALRLSKGMTYKALLADAALGGGKAVLIADPREPVSEAFLRSFGKAVDLLQGRYYTAEDSGINQKQLFIVSEETPYIVGLEREGSSGNPCPFTAWGVFRGMQATIHELTGSDSLAGKVIALQGLGAVGMRLAEILFWHGASLIVTDVCREKISYAKANYNAKAVSPEEIFAIPCDIFSPSAYGGILHRKTIDKLQCLAIAGCANNQLKGPEDGLLLRDRGILYAPDYVVNAGGLINVQFELSQEGYQPIRARDEVRKIYDRLKTVYSLAKTNNCSTEQAAFLIAEEKLHSHV